MGIKVKPECIRMDVLVTLDKAVSDCLFYNFRIIAFCDTRIQAERTTCLYNIVV